MKAFIRKERSKLKIEVRDNVGRSEDSEGGN